MKIVRAAAERLCTTSKKKRELDCRARTTRAAVVVVSKNLAYTVSVGAPVSMAELDIGLLFFAFPGMADLFIKV